jgi:CheY-like chemotaxis protein
MVEVHDKTTTMSKSHKKILLVEDDKALREAYEIILKAKGHTVRSARNGIDGLQKLKEETPDLILLDIFMPLMDGREFLRNFNADNYPSTKIFVLSNISNKEVEKEVLANGAELFLQKAELGPFDLARIVQEA